MNSDSGAWTDLTNLRYGQRDKRCAPENTICDDKSDPPPYGPPPHMDHISQTRRPSYPATSFYHNLINFDRNNLILCMQYHQFKMVYTEQDLTDALASYEQGGEPLRKLSLEIGIPRTTLYNRITGVQRRQDAFEQCQSLSRVQEDLTTWALEQVAIGNPPPHAQIREFARRILLAQGHPQPRIGKAWMTRFIRRNPILRTQRARRIDSVRVNGATGPIIQGWWAYLRVPFVTAILPANRYNMDEFGLMEGQGVNGLVVGSAHTRAIQRKTPGSRAWTSFIECISATGSTLPPAVIFKGKSVQQQWFLTDKDDLRGWLFTSTDKGWINQAVALQWLEQIFIPYTQPEDPTQQRLLVLDGHNSHTIVEFMWLCHSNNIHVIYLPAHTSHVLQPLDLSIFSPLKHGYCKYLNQLNNWSESTVEDQGQPNAQNLALGAEELLPHSPAEEAQNRDVLQTAGSPEGHLEKK